MFLFDVYVHSVSFFPAVSFSPLSDVRSPEYPGGVGGLGDLVSGELHHHRRGCG